MIPWYAQLILYFAGIFTSLFALSHLEWGQIVRSSRREFVWFTYAIIAVAVGFLIGFFAIKLVEIFYNIPQS